MESCITARPWLYLTGHGRIEVDFSFRRRDHSSHSLAPATAHKSGTRRADADPVQYQRYSILTTESTTQNFGYIDQDKYAQILSSNPSRTDTGIVRKAR